MGSAVFVFVFVFVFVVVVEIKIDKSCMPSTYTRSSTIIILNTFLYRTGRLYTIYTSITYYMYTVYVPVVVLWYTRKCVHSASTSAILFSLFHYL